MTLLRIGLLVNPVAGLGGKVGLKGSDGVVLQAEARARGGIARAGERTRAFLAALAEQVDLATLQWFCGAGSCGADALDSMGCPATTVMRQPLQGSAQDTRHTVDQMLQKGVDLLVFVGGDGTARDVLHSVGAASTAQLVLGVPAGVKMHSGVFAVTPRAAAAIVAGVVQGAFTTTHYADVVDFDEQRSSEGQSVSGAEGEESREGVQAQHMQVRRYGELRVPEAGGYLQHTKTGGRESEPIALEEICADVLERLDPMQTLILGPGGTLLALKEHLGLQGTLRGFDLLLPGGEVRLDVGSAEIERVAPGARLLISFTRQQGFLLGRGNQQLTPAALRALQDFEVLATRTKLASLGGRPLLVDTGDVALDVSLGGLVTIVSGYEDRMVHRIASQ